MALAFAGDGEDFEELADWLSIRRDFLEVVLREQTSERERLVSKGHIGPLQAASMRRGELTIRGELLWTRSCRRCSRSWRPPGRRRRN